jgi:hypothetical protein
MKRIISVIGLALVIGALSAASASAIVEPSELKVKAPNNGQKGNGGQSSYHAPPREVKTCVPYNDPGTATAQDPSPAIAGPCFINGN